jgi:hypothetical protein
MRVVDMQRRVRLQMFEKTLISSCLIILLYSDRDEVPGLGD